MDDNTQGQQEPIVSLDDVIGGPFAGGNNPTKGGTNPTPPEEPSTPPATPPATPPETPSQSINTGNQNPPDNGGQADDSAETVSFDGFVSRLTNPTDEDKETIDGVLETFKGANLDTKGNVLNDKGEIILSAEKLKDFVDNDNLPLDENGNMVDDKGNILQTSQQLLQQNSLVLATKASIEENFGIKFPEGYEIDDTEEGLIELVNDAVALQNRNSVADFLDSSPVLKSFYQHLVLGKSPETFNDTNVDYRGINILGLNKESKLSYIKEMFKQQGNENPDAFMELLSSSTDEALNKNVASAILYLDKQQTESNEAREVQIKEQRQAQAQADQAYWADIKNVVTKGKLNEVTIPLLERDKFYQYLASPVNEGKSQDMIDSANDSKEFDVMVSYLRYKKYDISKLAANISRESKVSTLKSRFEKHNRMKATSGVPRNVSSKGGSGAGISLDDITG